MARKKLKDRNIRKLIKGTTSYSITLPIEAVQFLKWRKSQKLVVDLDKSRKRLIVKDWPSGRSKKK